MPDALEDGDSILAVIKGSAVNQDGRSNGLTAPNGPSQEAVIKNAIRQAGIDPNQISYVECHGTGTELGDPQEVLALNNALKTSERKNKCLIGSVKTNIGHLEAAAGMAGLIKVILSLQNQKIPPHLNFDQLNPKINLKDTPFEIPTTLSQWPTNFSPHYAGISSFGFGGTNAHMILASPPCQENENHDELQRPSHVLALSAKSPPSLKRLIVGYSDYLDSHTDLPIEDICYSTNTTRSQFSYRIAVVGDSTSRIASQLKSFSNPRDVGFREFGSLFGHSPFTAFLFSGQGSQYPGMGYDLYKYHPTFREHMERCATLFDQYLPNSILSILFNESAAPVEFQDTLFVQPALMALEYSLAKLMESWGIFPNIVIGHSVGEYAAACFAGVMTLDEGVKLVAHRARLMHDLPSDAGGMAVILTDLEQVQPLISQYQDTLTIAAINGPENITISGKQENLQKALQELQSQGFATHTLRVSHAFHSPLMDPILEKFRTVAEEVTFSLPRIPMISTLTGQLISAKHPMDATYWTRQIRQPVQFYPAVSTLRSQGVQCCVEIGPGKSLLNLANQCLTDHEWEKFPTLIRGVKNWETILNSLAKLYMAGTEVNWKKFDQGYTRKLVSLPTYPFDRKRYWVAPRTRAESNKSPLTAKILQALEIAARKKINTLVDNINLSKITNQLATLN